MTGLRTKWGVNLSYLDTWFGQKYYFYCLKNAQPFIQNRMLHIEENILKLSHDGIFVSDGIMSELMWID